MTAEFSPGLKLSVVVAAWNGRSSLERCLRSLDGDGRAPDTEVIVVTNFGAGASEMITNQFSFVHHVAMPSGTTVPVMRTAGIQHSRGEIVALAEDHCTFDGGWSQEIKKAHQLPYSAIGGSVENASVDRAVDWAVYFYDYGKFMLPGRPGVVRSLSGNNASYKRAVLKEVETSFQQGFFEPFTNGEIERRGHPLYLVPSAIVYNRKSHTFKDAATQSYHLARGYAGKRVAGASLGRRGFFVLGSLLLPGILTVRIVGRIVSKGRNVAALVRAFPCLLLLLFGWSWGEFLGYLAGEGSSAGEWK